MIVQFTYYLHDTLQGDEREQFIQRQIGQELSEEVLANIGQPFYEVGILCEIDTETGRVELLHLVS